MSRLGPIVTLAVGAVIAAGLGVASITTAPASDTTAVAEPSTPIEASSEASPEASSEATPAPTKAVKAAKVKADYAGRVTGNGGLIAISVRDGKAVGYFCDGKTEAWFTGKAANGELTLEGFGGAEVSARLGGGRAKGELAVGDKKWDFTAPVAVKPSGLYRASAQVRNARIKAGWIVLKRPDGNGFTQVGFTSLGDEQVPTPTLVPGEPVTVGGIEVQPKDVDGFIEEMS